MIERLDLATAGSGPVRLPVDSGQLRTVVSGSVTRRVIHADGHLSETSCRVLMALTEELVRNRCTHVRLDLSGVTVVDIGCLRSLRQFRAILRAMGIFVGFTERGRLFAR